MTRQARAERALLLFLVFASVAFAILFFAVGRNFSNAEELIERDAVAARNVLMLKKIVLDMQSGKRGFLLSGEDEFLEPFILGEQELGRVLLEELRAENDTARRAQLERVQELMEDWIRESAVPETQRRRDVNVGRASLGELELMQRSHVGSDIILQAREELRNMSISDEQRFEANLNKLKRDIEVLRIALAVLASLTAFACGLLVYRRRERKQ